MIRTAPSYQRDSRSGFMLMEVMVSVIILAVVMTALMKATIGSISSTRETQLYSRGILLAQQKMWELENEYAYAENGELGRQQGEFSEEFPDYSWEAEIERDEDRLVYIIFLKTKWLYNEQERFFTLMTESPMAGDEVERRR